MARCLQIRRGTTAEHATFKGAVAELSVSTDDSRLRIHDGVKAGGHPVVLREDLATNSDYGIVRFATLEELAKSEDADGLDTVVVSAKDLKKFCRETSLSAMPIGTMIFYLGKTIPEGWLLANGSTYDTTLYPDLYAVLGTNTLPNMHHRFLEGTTTLSEVGSYIAAGLPNSQGKIFDLVSTSPDRKTSFTGSMGWSIRDDINTCGYLQYVEASTKGYQCDPFSDLSKGNAIFGASDTVQTASMRALYLIRAYQA